MGLGGEGFPTLGPFPIGDHFWSSDSMYYDATLLKPGKNVKTIQFETLRKNRLAHANY